MTNSCCFQAIRARQTSFLSVPWQSHSMHGERRRNLYYNLSSNCSTTLSEYVCRLSRSAVPIPFLFKIVFTYDIVWKLDRETTWSQRWDVYLKGNPEVGLLVLLRYLYIYKRVSASWEEKLGCLRSAMYQKWDDQRATKC